MASGEEVQGTPAQDLLKKLQSAYVHTCENVGVDQQTTALQWQCTGQQDHLPEQLASIGQSEEVQG